MRQFAFYVHDVRVFNALHGMQTRSSDEKAVLLPVRPSVRPQPLLI